MKTNYSLLITMLLSLSTLLAQTTYKMGDLHPDGGMVYSVNPAGNAGFMVSTKDIGRFTYEEALKAAKNDLGEGWIMPNKNQLNEIYVNLHKKGLGDFKPELYRSGEASSYVHYPWAQNFANGKQEGSALNNKVLSRAIKPFSQKMATTKNTLNAGENLNNSGENFNSNDILVSSNNQYMLRLQKEDGNLCIYKYVNGKQGGFVWCSMASGFSNGVLKMQKDGNLVVYNGNNEVKWDSKTHPFFDKKFADANNKPVKLVLENNGSLVLYTAAGVSAWSNK